MHEVTTPQAAAYREGGGLWSLKPCAALDDMLEGPGHYKHVQGWYVLKFGIRKKVNRKHPYHNEAPTTQFVWAGDFFFLPCSPASTLPCSITGANTDF